MNYRSFPTKLWKMKEPPPLCAWWTVCSGILIINICSQIHLVVTPGGRRGWQSGARVKRTINSRTLLQFTAANDLPGRCADTQACSVSSSHGCNLRSQRQTGKCMQMERCRGHVVKTTSPKAAGKHEPVQQREANNRHSGRCWQESIRQSGMMDSSFSLRRHLHEGHVWKTEEHIWRAVEPLCSGDVFREMAQSWCSLKDEQGEERRWEEKTSSTSHSLKPHQGEPLPQKAFDWHEHRLKVRDKTDYNHLVNANPACSLLLNTFIFFWTNYVFLIFFW